MERLKTDVAALARPQHGSSSTRTDCSNSLSRPTGTFSTTPGTRKCWLSSGNGGQRDVLFDLDWQGTQQVAERARDDLVSVFILPPSTAELERRLQTRAQDSHEVIADRMAKAADEITHWSEYDYVVVNESFEDSVAKVMAILDAERLRRHRQEGLSDLVRLLRQGQ